MYIYSLTIRAVLFGMFMFIRFIIEFTVAVGARNLGIFVRLDMAIQIALCAKFSSTVSCISSKFPRHLCDLITWL